MKKSKYNYAFLIFIVSLCFTSCEDFLEVDVPDHKMVSEVVFSDDETAIGAMTGIYNQLLNATYSSGGGDSVTNLAGLSADDLTTIRANNLTFMEFDQHEILTNNSRNLNLWSSAYNIIYMANSLLEGLANSVNISDEVQNRLEGEAKFVRAFTYFYLVNLYGEVPVILTTDYTVNALKSRSSVDEIYQQILKDLLIAEELLGENYILGERTQITRFTAIALMSRVHLYLENWVEAENLSTQVIEQSGTYELLENLDNVFLRNSKEAIWQLSPVGRGNGFTYTNEGLNFIIHPFIPVLSHVKLNENFVESFEEQDKRFRSWISFNERIQGYYPSKYKIRLSTEDPTEYSMVLRVAEQFLIRAEARVKLGDLSGAIADLNKIRGRAGLSLFEASTEQFSPELLLKMILEGKKKELFTEWGHRWLDIKRLEMGNELFGENPLWQETDYLYPIPESERIKNTNLTQNAGY